MGMGNILLLSQVIAFLVSFLGSFFIFIPVSINLQEFDGHCLLGAKGTWNFSSGNVMLMDIKWGLHSDCGFSIFIGIVAMILSVFFIVWQSVNLFKNTDSSWVDAFVTCVICIIMCLLLFICSLILSVGYHRWCKTLTGYNSPFSRCEETEMNVNLDSVMAGARCSLAFLAFLGVICRVSGTEVECKQPPSSAESVYSFTAPDIYQTKNVSLSKYRGKVLVITNLASF